jgi:TldD protein
MREYMIEAISSVVADYIEIRIEEITKTRIDYVGKELEHISISEERGGCVRVLKNNAWGVVCFNNIDKLKEETHKAAKIAQLVESNVKLVKATPVVDEHIIRWGKNPLEISLSEKKHVCEVYNNIVLNSNSKIQTSNIRYRDVAVKKYFANSEGTYILQDSVFCGISISAVARDGINIQQAHFSIGDFNGYNQVQELEKEAEQVAKRAVDLLSAEQITGGKYTVVIDPKLCGVFIHEAFGHLSEADFLYENPQLQELMQIGKRFGPEELSVIDYPCIPGEAGYYLYDDEGVKGQKTYLIKDGILSHRLHSRETASKMNETYSTGNARAVDYTYEPLVRMSNTYLEPKEDKFEEMIASIPYGIYAKGALGGMTNCEMFTFSAEEAFLIKNGKITKLLRDVVLTGNVFETLANIEAIGDDLRFYGGLGGCGKAGQSPLPVATGGPHIKIRDVIIGG